MLADPEAEGATYIDVRLPGRPAAGGLPAATLAPVAPAGTAGTTPTRAPPTVDPATEQLGARRCRTATRPPPQPNAPADSASRAAQPTAPQSAEPAPAPTDSTGAGGASPPLRLSLNP